MADGPPDFTDLLAALEPPAALNVDHNHPPLSVSHGQMRGGLPQSQIQFLDQQQQQISQYGQRISHFPQMNSLTLSSQGNFQHSIVQKNDTGNLLGAIQAVNASQIDNAVPVEEEQHFGGGGSLGSMFLSSVESLLSDEGNNPFPLGISTQQSRQTARRPRQRQKLTNQGRTVNRNIQNINTVPSANIALPTNTVPVTCYVQTVSMHSPINSNQNANIKNTELTASPFIAPSGMQQMQAGGMSFVGSGHQKATVQTQFAHPAQGVRQQIQPTIAQNPPRPLSASSSTSDHNSRPSSVHQPSPSCGSNHSGDPATPQSYSATTPQSYNPSTPQSYNPPTPQSYNPSTPQSYNPPTPQSRSVTPLSAHPQHQQHQPSVMTDLSQQGAGNMALMMNNGNILSASKIDAVHQNNSHQATEDSLADLPTPVKEAILSQNMKSNAAGNVFQNIPHVNQHPHSSVTWSSSGSFQNTGVPPGQIELTKPNIGRTPTIEGGYLSSNMTRLTNHHPNEYSGQIVSPFNVAQQQMIGQSFERDSCYSTSSLTLTQSRLLEQMSSFGKTKSKPSGNPFKPVQSSNHSGALSSTLVPENSIGGLQNIPQNSTTMELINRASNTGAATVRELFHSDAARYEAISPVSDYAPSPRTSLDSKTSLVEEQPSGKSIFPTSKYQKSILTSEQENSNTSTQSFTGEDIMNDPVLMYLKHDNPSPAGVSDVFSSNQSAFPPYDVSINSRPTLPASYGAHTTKEWKNLPTVPDRNGNNTVSPTFLPEGFPTTKIAGNRYPPEISSNSNPLHFKAATEQSDQVAVVQRTQKIGQFGVNRRGSATDQLKDGPNKSDKGDSFDLNFGFGSDEPTIRLKSQSTRTGATLSSAAAKSENLQSPKRSVTAFPTNQKIGNDMKDAMEQLAKLSQQKEMLLQIQKYQVQQGTVNAQAAMPDTPYQPPGMFQSQIPKPSSATGPFEMQTRPVRNIENFLSTKSEKWDEVLPQPQTTNYYNSNSNKELDVAHDGVFRPLKSETVQQPSIIFPKSTDMPSKSFYPSTSSTTTQHSIQQIDLSVKMSASTYPSPMFVSVPESVSCSSTSVSSFNKFLLPTSSVSTSSVPTYFPQHSVPPMLPVPPLPIRSHLDFDWLHGASKPNEIQRSTVPSTISIDIISAPSAPLSTSMNTVYSYADNHNVRSTSVATTECTVTSKPIPIISPGIDTRTTDRTNSNTTVTPSTKQLFSPVPSSSVSKDVIPSVHHETKYHHYGKKHRILEGSYPSLSESYQKYGPNNVPTNQQAPTTSFAAGQSVLDKQRKYSREQSLKSLLDTSKTPVTQNHLPKVIESMESKEINLPVTSYKPTEPVSAPTVTTAASVMITTASKNKPLAVIAEKEKPAKKNQRSGSMLSLFNSLLQEASDSLKTNLATEVEVPKTSVVKNLPETIKEETLSSKNSIAVPTEPVVITAVATPSPVTVHKPISDIKTVKKTRPAATVPFKRRPYPAIEDSVVTTATQISSSNSTVTTTLTTTAATTVSSSVTPSTLSSLITTAMSSSIQSSVPPTPLSPPPVITSYPTVSILTNDAKTPSSVSQPTESSLKIALPKLRITTFRSSGGQVILQSSMIGDHAVSEVEKDPAYKKSKKKKKKRKKRRRLSSSEYDSSVSSLTSISSYEPTNKSGGADAASHVIMAASKLSAVVESKMENEIDIPLTTTPPESIAKDIVRVITDTRKRSGSVGKDTEKKKPAAKRAKVAKDSVKKKTQVPKESKKKEPIVRYQPKSAYQAVTSSSVKSSKDSVPRPCHRAPGKLPLYLNTSETKSITVPTIQLGARNTKLLESCLETKMTSPPQSKVVSVKIGNSITTKAIQNQILSSSGLQYIMPARSQPRIILPNISSSIPLPVSIVSPINNRATGTFIPPPITMSTASISTSSTKSQILLIPQPSVSSPQSVEVKTSAPPIILSASSGSASTSTVNSNLLTIVSAVQNVSKATNTILPCNSANTESNMFQSTFLKLISSQNPIANYSPPAPPSHLMIDANSKKEHQCLECRDKFLHQSSLEDHYDRRCIMIKVRCMQCNQNLVFLNKCNLLRHAREHSDKGNGMQFNNAHISPLTTAMCKPRSKEFFLHKNVTGASRNRLSTCSTTDDESSSDNLQNSACMMACTDCNFLASSPEALEEHFQQQPSPPSPEVQGQSTNSTAKPSDSLTCDMCHLTLYNQCSFMAHMRMHKRISPHTCPECGQTFDGKDMEFNLHLSIQCFHLSRMSCYKCRLCSSIFQTGDLLRRHLEVRHLQTFYKCRECPMAFKTQANIASHQRSAHGIAAVTKTIHKCPLCDTVFTDNSHTQQLFLLQKHFEGHINHPSINITAYKCLVCNNIYERKSLLREHLKTVHDVTSPGDSGSSSDLTKEINKAENLLDIGRRKENGTKKPGKGAKRYLPCDKPQTVKEAKASKSTDENSVESSNALIASGILGTSDSQKKVASQSGAAFSSKLLSSGSPSNIKHTRQPLKLRLKGMNTHSTNGIDSTNVPKQQDDDCAESPSQFEEDDNVKHDKKNNLLFITTEDGKKLYPCMECGKEFYSSHSRCNHVRAKHRGIRTLYCCPYCPVDKIKFAKRISLVKHLKKTHSIMQITKKDIKLVSAHVSVPAGHRFNASTVTLSKDGSETVVQNVSNENAGLGIPNSSKVRKKHTTLARKQKSLKSSEIVNRRISLDTSSDDERPNDGPSHENRNARVDKIEECEFSSLRLPDTYTCAKCNYQSDDRLEFQAHIQEHREDMEPGLNSSMQQCRECGLCFASSASLAKHLFIKHKVKRKEVLEKYDEHLVAERTAAGNLPKSLMSQDGMMSVSADGSGVNIKKKQFKCQVCYHRFDEDSQLRTHMRTHGLAFVKSKHNLS